MADENQNQDDRDDGGNDGSAPCKAGATNAGLLAAQILSTTDLVLAEQLDNRRESTKQAVLESSGDLV